MQKKYRKLGKELDLCGSLLISTEGCNATVAGAPEKVETFFRILKERFPNLAAQDSYSSVRPYQRWKVPLKAQVVQARDTNLSPDTNYEGQKTPQEWDEIRRLVQKGQAQMIDVRNCYEVEIGTFPEAIDPGTLTFKQFSDYLDREVGKTLQAELPTAIFCTGGIRCEKARMDLERRGFTEVWQLKGGILKYLKDSQERGFQGECFVFDERVALTASLSPTRTYKLCPHCGGPTPIGAPKHRCVEGRDFS